MEPCLYKGECVPMKKFFRLTVTLCIICLVGIFVYAGFFADSVVQETVIKTIS